MTNKEIWLYLKCRNSSNNNDSGNSGESGGGDVDIPTDPPIPTTEFNYSITNNEVTITGLKDKSVSGDIVIPSKIEGYDVTSIGEYAFRYCSSLTSVDIPNGVTNIGYGAFYGCSSLTSVNIPNSVSSIGIGAFNGCTSLTNIILQGNVTEIKGSMFRNCINLTSLTIPEGVTTLEGDIVNGCSNLIKLYLPSTLTTVASNAFYNINNALEVIRLGDNFNYNNLNVSFSNRYSNEIIVNMLNALADRTGETAYTLRLGTTNLAKLTDEEIAIATNKNWTLA